MVDLFERELDTLVHRLQAADRAAHADLLRSYRSVHLRLMQQMADLGERIERARAQGVEVRPGWLFAQDRYRVLLADLDQGTADFVRSATETVTVGQRRSIEAARDLAGRFATAAAGPAPDSARRSLLDAFARVNHGALQHVVGYSADGRPLGDLLATLAPQNVNGVRDALAFGTATGRPVRLIARDVQQASGSTLSRALGISRTEAMRASRAAAADSYARSGAVTGWTWYAAPDARTCPICWAMNGTVHSLSETLDSHPMCRCTMVPRTKSWSELGFDGIPDRQPTIETGEDLFRRQPASVQRAVLGPTRYRLWQQGDVRLADMVRPADSRFGPGKRVANLDELARPVRVTRAAPEPPAMTAESDFSLITPTSVPPQFEGTFYMTTSAERAAQLRQGKFLTGRGNLNEGMYTTSSLQEAQMYSRPGAEIVRVQFRTRNAVAEPRALAVRDQVREEITQRTGERPGLRDPELNAEATRRLRAEGVDAVLVDAGSGDKWAVLLDPNAFLGVA